MSLLLLGLLRHVVSDKYVDVDFENANVELSKKYLSKIVIHVDMYISKMLKKSNFVHKIRFFLVINRLLITAGVIFVLFLFTVVLIYMYI